MPVSRDDIDIEEVVKLHAEENISVFAISILLDVSEPFIRKTLKNAGVVIRRIRSVGVRHKGPISREHIRDLFRDEFLSINQIGLKLGISRKQVLNVLKDWGIEVPGVDQEIGELDALPSGIWRCFERRSAEYRELIRTARKRKVELQVKNVGRGRVWLARKGKFLHCRYKIMRPFIEERKESMRRLYEEDKLSGHAIAEMYQISAYRVYAILSDAGVATPGLPRFRVTEIGKDRLERLYLQKRFSVPQIADKLKIGTRHVVRELVRHGIWSDARETDERKFPGIELLKIGESMIIQWNQANQSYLSRESRWFNIRVIYRQINNETSKLTRTPHFTMEEVVKYHNNGLTTGELAKLFVSNRPKILKFKRMAGIQVKSPRPRKET